MDVDTVLFDFGCRLVVGWDLFYYHLCWLLYYHFDIIIGTPINIHH